MKLLVVDTSLGLCTVGVFEVDSAGASCLGLRSEPMTKGHSERIAGFARDAATAAGVSFAHLDRIGVTVGPGSFTGLRVGLAFAQGLAAALGRPLVGISGLDALAASAGEAPEVAALIDARRGQVYARVWRGGVADGPAEALTLELDNSKVSVKLAIKKQDIETSLTSTRTKKIFVGGCGGIYWWIIGSLKRQCPETFLPSKQLKKSCDAVSLMNKQFTPASIT